MNAADEFNQYFTFSVDHVDRRHREETRVDARSFLLRITHEDSRDLEPDAVPRSDAIALAVDQPHESPAHGSASEQTDSHGFHEHAAPACASTPASACSRSSIRSRTSSSPTDNRISPSPMPTLRRVSASTDACV